MEDRAWAADVDGDGRDEIVVHKPAADWMAVLKWTGTELKAAWMTRDWAPGGWNMSAEDRIYVADVDGDGRDEIVVHKPAADWMAVLKWTGTELKAAWMTRDWAPGGWNMSAEDRIYVADVDGDGRDEIVVHKPAADWMAVLKWTGTELKAAWMTRDWAPGGWNMSAEDRIYVADVDGDGRDEIVVHKPAADWMAVLKWTGTELKAAWMTRDWAPGGWNMSAEDRIYVADVDGDGRDEIVVHKPAADWMAVLKWTGTELKAAWMTRDWAPGGWNMSAEDRIYVADVDGDGRDEIVVHKPAADWMAVLKWTGTELKAAWMTRDWVSPPGRVNEGWNLTADDRTIVLTTGSGCQALLTMKHVGAPSPASLWPTHWVTYLGGLNVSDGSVRFECYSWGRTCQVQLTREAFEDYMFGVVAGT